MQSLRLQIIFFILQFFATYSTNGQSVAEQLAIFKKSNLSFTTFFTEISSKGVQISLNFFLLKLIISFPLIS